jgi:hypothetical protein
MIGAMAEQSTQVQTNSLAPALATVDGATVQQQAIADQILGDQYAAAAAAIKKRRRGMYFSKLIPAGPMSDAGGSRQGPGFLNGSF